jgi:hypothetical protein
VGVKIERYKSTIESSDTPAKRKLAEMRAKEIELDILSCHFDQTTATS